MGSIFLSNQSTDGEKKAPIQTKAQGMRSNLSEKVASGQEVAGVSKLVLEDSSLKLKTKDTVKPGIDKGLDNFLSKANNHSGDSSDEIDLMKNIMYGKNNSKKKVELDF